MPRPTHINNLLGTIWHCQTMPSKITLSKVLQYKLYLRLVIPLAGYNGINTKWLQMACNNYVTILRAYNNKGVT